MRARKSKPVRKPGERNIFCPYYDDCLNFAVKRHWQYFDCSQCPSKMVKQAIMNTESMSNDGIIIYELPSRGVGAGEWCDF
jgi:hypothetical protein